MQYATFPIPDTCPDYLDHAMVARYLDDFVDHFRFRGRVRFRTAVTRVEPAETGGWDVTARHRDTGVIYSERYASVLVANGHHWDPRYPEPAFPGADAFGGAQLHSHAYRTPEPFTGRRVLVLGIGNSACDIAAECSQVAARTVLAMRRWAVGLLLRAARGTVTSTGLPRPDHRLLCSPPTVSDRLLRQLDRGAIVVKPAIDRFETGRVRFADGTAEEVDTVIYCTGYKISFPFLDPALISVEGNQVSLYRRVVPPGLPGLYFIGLVQPIGATMPIAEAQSEWVADLLEERAVLPAQPQMNGEIARYRAANARRYAPSSRPAIQVDFLGYLSEIATERRSGARRAVARRVPAPPRPAPRVARHASSAFQA
jgi:hypothetical protein